jgi:putative flavoprotein involved in K+ transport
VRNEVTSYLESYAEKFSLPVETNKKVISVFKEGEIFKVTASDGSVYHSKFIISAAGSFSNPYIPTVKGAENFKGKILHSYEYSEPKGLEGKRIIVAGGGNSAVQIAVELAEYATVTIASQKSIIYLPQKFIGLDGHFWLKYLLLDKLKVIKDMNTPVVNSDNYRQKIKSGRPNRKKMFKEFYNSGVVWQNGEKEEVDVVIFATGFRPNISHLSGLNITDAKGNIRHKSGISTDVDGLYFVGLSGQRAFSSATLRGVGKDAKFIVNEILKNI